MRRLLFSFSLVASHEVEAIINLKNAKCHDNLLSYLIYVFSRVFYPAVSKKISKVIPICKKRIIPMILKIIDPTMSIISFFVTIFLRYLESISLLSSSQLTLTCHWPIKLNDLMANIPMIEEDAVHWFTSNNLLLNATKTEKMIFSLRELKDVKNP